MLAVVAIVVFIYEAMAQETAGSLSAWSSSSGSLKSSTGSEVGIVPATTVAQELAQEWFSANFCDNETQLAVGVDSDLKNLSSSDIICNGVPSLQRRSDELLPNFGCPDIFTAIDASCTCLDAGYNDSEVWEFRVTQRRSASDYPTALTSADILPVDSIRTMLVPSTLKTLRIIGDGNLPQDIEFTPEDRRIPGTILPIAISPNDSVSITTVEITNINMFSITLSASSFLPPTTTNLTLRNCNLFGFGFHFFDGVTNLQHLDLSSNSLTVPYAGSTTQSSCSNQFCAIETLNLTNNSLTTFPTVVLNIDNLQELYIAHNDITDFNISNSTFNVIQSLKAFESDLPDTSAICPGGTWQTAHSSKFCVANSTIAVSESSSGTCTQCITYVGIIGGCLIVALIVLLLWQRARSRRRALSASLVSSPSSYYLARSGNETVNIQISDKSTAEALLEDPVIITNRINYKEIKLGKCLSRGGFGLVFVGEYKGCIQTKSQMDIPPPLCNPSSGDQDALWSPVAVCTMRWCVWLSLLLSTSAAQSSSSSSTSSSGSGSSNGSDAGATTKAEILAQDWFQANSDENVTYLAVGVNSKLSNITDGDIICGKGVPSLQRRTTAALPNNGCPAIFTALNGSCTCLPDYNTTDSWEFFVTKKTTEIDYPLTMNDTEVLPIDTIRTLLVPSTVVSLSITGVGDGLQSISFVPQDVALPGSNIPVAVNADDARDVSSITAVRLENIDMSLIVMNTGHFFPSTTLNLTMRNCGLETFGFDFFQGLKTVEYLDFSENNLAKPYAGNTISKTCTTQFCAVQILNLTGNQLTSFPSVVFNLDDLSELYIRNNNFTDFNVTTSVFNSISALRAYESDRPDDSATCSNGTWKAAHRVKFCVLNDTADTEDSSSDSKIWSVCPPPRRWIPPERLT
ncbi:hypothetical protein PC121_g16757 [Phytophthora cactorum]|nr:hypothetical protein PC121_g16757 [Phytophthora cactorum]